MKKVFDLDIGKNYVRYFSPHSRACYYDTDTNQLVFLNAPSPIDFKLFENVTVLNE